MKVHFKIQRQAVSAKVTKVYEHVEQAERRAENPHELRRHWDDRVFEEDIITCESVVRYFETPEEWYIRKETLQEIILALQGCTGAQSQHFLLFALDGQSYSEIACLCGCSRFAVRNSIETVRKKCRPFFKNRSYETPISGY